MKKKKRLAALRRASDRRAKSCFLVVIFLAVFACMLLTEVFYVEEERWREEKFLSMFNFGDDDDIPESAVGRTAVRDPDNETAGMVVEEELGWQRVANTKDKFFVYSAYYDDRRATKWVRVIAAARTRLADKVVCKFTGGSSPFSSIGVNRLIRENWNLKYSAYFVLCPLKQTLQGHTHVSIVRQGEGAVSNRMPIRDNRRLHRGQRGEGVAVCVKPLHYEYNKVGDLIEFIELNRILGVEHFVLYNHTVGGDAGCVLRKYAQEGVVDLLPWQLDIPSQKEIRTEGLFAALNDCLYRTMHRFRFVLMIDLDEYVIPHRDRTLRGMLERLLSKSPDRTGAFSFQNAFFYLQWPDDAQSAGGLPYPLLTMRKTRRKAKLHAHKQRSKCAVLPDRVVEMGNHFVWEFVQGRSGANVPPDTAFLHHYRVCEFGGDDCVNTTHVTDRRAYEWRDALLDMVALRLRLLQPACPHSTASLLTRRH